MNYLFLKCKIETIGGKHGGCYSLINVSAYHFYMVVLPKQNFVPA